MAGYWEPPEGGVGGPEPIAPIGPRGPRTDREITEGVRDAFILDADLDDGALDVRTKNAIVDLYGRVPNEQMRRRAIDLALAVEGVEDVKDHLVVQ